MKGLVICQQLMPAWMAGNKSVTRRLMNPQPGENAYIWSEEKNGINFANPASFSRFRYQSGESVYIKETWHCDDPAAAQDVMSRGEGLFYKAGMAEQEASMFKWKSPRFMPEWAARSHALIVSVRPGRVREITEEEAKAEGVEPDRSKVNGMPPVIYSHRDSFRRLWESLHPGSWERNDFIWRIELEKK